MNNLYLARSLTRRQRRLRQSNPYSSYSRCHQTVGLSINVIPYGPSTLVPSNKSWSRVTSSTSALHVLVYWTDHPPCDSKLWYLIFSWLVPCYILFRPELFETRTCLRMKYLLRFRYCPTGGSSFRLLGPFIAVPPGKPIITASRVIMLIQ